MNTNDEMDGLHEQGVDLIKRMGIAVKIGMNSDATDDQKLRAYKSVRESASASMFAKPDCDSDFDVPPPLPDFDNEDVPPPLPDFDFNCATDSNEDVPPLLPVAGKENVDPFPSRRRKFDTLVDDQEISLEKSRVRFKRDEKKQKKPHGNTGIKRTVSRLLFAWSIIAFTPFSIDPPYHPLPSQAAFKEAARQTGLDRFASGDSYLKTNLEVRAAEGDILGQKLARIATKDLAKICRGTKDGQLVIRELEKFMRGYYGKDKVPAIGTKAYEKMATRFLARLRDQANFELVEQPKGPAYRARRGDKFVLQHPDFILDDNDKLASIVYKRVTKGAGKGKFSNWSDDETSDLVKYAAMYKHQAGRHAGKTNWDLVAEEVGRSSEECQAKFKRLSKSK